MIDVETIETPSLGDRSYVATDGECAMVVDPQRDIDRIMERLAARCLRLTHVLETHLHNDYVTGGYQLARETGARYVLPAGDEVRFDRLAMGGGEHLESGELRVRALHTPGHTHHHLSYVLEDTTGSTHGVFTGGSMLFGATGRTDLLGPEHTDVLTRAQFHSVRRIAAELPGSTPVFPTHGFGSFCSATPASGDDSTVGEQARTNPALTLDEQEFVDTLLAGLDAYPAYYAHMAPINQAGPPALDLSDPRPVDQDELRRRLEAREWVVDLRARTAFAAGHLAGAFNIEGGRQFVTYLGWLYPWQVAAPLTLLGESAEQVREARRQLVRIGIDVLAGAAVGKPEEVAGDALLRTYPVSDFAVSIFAGLARVSGADACVLDVRRNDEFQAGHIRDALHVPLHELPGRCDELPPGSLWVHCGSGYRAAIAASMVDATGREVVLIDDAFDRAEAAGLTLVPTEDEHPRR